MAKALSGTVKEVLGLIYHISFEDFVIKGMYIRISKTWNVVHRLGTAQSVGCTVDGNHPHNVIEKVDSGEYSVPAS